MSDSIYFEGDPSQDSARRHMERVLKEPQTRKWPLLAALFAGGTAFTLWRVRQRRRNNGAQSAATSTSKTSTSTSKTSPSKLPTRKP
jgi:hypothetical protein